MKQAKLKHIQLISIDEVEILVVLVMIQVLLKTPYFELNNTRRSINNYIQLS